MFNASSLSFTAYRWWWRVIDGGECGLCKARSGITVSVHTGAILPRMAPFFVP